MLIRSASGLFLGSPLDVGDIEETELARSHQERDMGAVDAKLDELKAKLSRSQNTPG
jgi:hypothetical protein